MSPSSTSITGVPVEFGGRATAAAFDNFKATADGVLCDGVPIPPLKPRP